MEKSWRERIMEAEGRGTFTREDKALAAEWATCAVGEQRAQYPEVITFQTTSFGIDLYPEDGDLYRLGCSIGFYGAILSNDFQSAWRHLDAIENRVLDLKRDHAAQA